MKDCVWKCNQVKMRSCWARMGPNPMIDVLIRRNLDTMTPRNMALLKWRQRLGVIMLQAKECKRLLATTRREEERKAFLGFRLS